MSEIRPTITVGFRVGMLTVEKRTAEKRTVILSGYADAIVEAQSSWIPAVYNEAQSEIAAVPQE